VWKHDLSCYSHFTTAVPPRDRYEVYTYKHSAYMVTTVQESKSSIIVAPGHSVFDDDDKYDDSPGGKIPIIQCPINQSLFNRRPRNWSNLVGRNEPGTSLLPPPELFRESWHGSKVVWNIVIEKQNFVGNPLFPSTFIVRLWAPSCVYSSAHWPD